MLTTSFHSIMDAPIGATDYSHHMLDKSPFLQQLHKVIVGDRIEHLGCVDKYLHGGCVFFLQLWSLESLKLSDHLGVALSSVSESLLPGYCQPLSVLENNFKTTSFMAICHYVLKSFSSLLQPDCKLLLINLGFCLRPAHVIYLSFPVCLCTIYSYQVKRPV